MWYLNFLYPKKLFALNKIADLSLLTVVINNIKSKANNISVMTLTTTDFMSGDSLFHIAAQANKTDAIIFLSLLITINVSNHNNGNMPLHSACHNGHLAVKTLLDYGGAISGCY